MQPGATGDDSIDEHRVVAIASARPLLLPAREQRAALLQRLRLFASPLGWLLPLGLLGVVVGYLLYSFLRHPIAEGDPEEVPLIGHQIAVHLPTQEEKPASLLEDASGHLGSKTTRPGCGEPGRG